MNMPVPLPEMTFRNSGEDPPITLLEEWPELKLLFPIAIPPPFVMSTMPVVSGPMKLPAIRFPPLPSIRIAVPEFRLNVSPRTMLLPAVI